jgi:RsiW-degrading membrane proteinase PrsW (M82 family)
MGWSKFNAFMTGNDLPWSLHFKEMFSRSFKKRSKEKTDSEETFSPIPRPWRWTRTFLFLLVMTIVYDLIVMNGGIIVAFPWLALIAASVLPITILVLLYECASVEEVPLIHVTEVFFIGTAVALLAFISLNVIPLPEDWAAILAAPILEELAKIVAIYIVFAFWKIRRVSTALLIGWTIGAGFQIVETLGYSTIYGLAELISEEGSGVIDDSTLFFRSVFAFGSHALYGAMEAAGLMFSRPIQEGEKGNSRRIWLWGAIAVIFHMSWNLNAVLSSEDTVKLTWIALGLEVITIPVFFYLLDAGIRDQKRWWFELQKSAEVPETPEEVPNPTESPASFIVGTDSESSDSPSENVNASE